VENNINFLEYLLNMERFSKKQREIYTVTVDYVGRLPVNLTISAATVEIIEKIEGTNTTNNMLIGTPLISGEQIKAQVENGESGKDYIINFFATLSNGDIWQDNLVMSVGT
jgi:hypothetical protein